MCFKQCYGNVTSLSQLIHIRIRNLDPDPDPGKRKVDTQKRRKKYCFKELDILSGGLEAAHMEL